ncbi:CIA30 family protein, partial [[Eubacterium] siraeum]
AEGVDFEKLMTIDTLDFGTPHLYLDQWGMKHTGTGQDDLLWFKIHGETCAELDKPVILEEFGLTNRAIRDSEYEQWFEVLEGNVYETVEYAGTNYWMIASYIDGALYPDYDQYTVYGPEGTDTESTRQLIMKHAANMTAKNNVNTIASDKLNFDRADNTDLTVTAAMKEGVISGITLDGNALTEGKDFTINNNSVTIKASYLKTLELKSHVFTLNCTAGSSPKFTVNVTDVSIPAPTLDKYIATVDKNLRHYKQVNVGYDKKTSEFRGITVNGKYLTAGTDYTDNGGLVTFSDSFVRPLGEGNVTLVFDFYEGADCEFQLTVTDTSTLEDIDTFENYTDDSQLRSAYTPNTNGNNITVSLVDSTNGKAMRFEYDVSLPNGYSGVNHALSQRNVAQYKGVSITLAGDNSGNTFTLQFKDKNDNYFEKEFAVDFYGEKTIKIPFEEFNTPSWQSSSATLDTTGIVQVAFYAGRRGNADTGAYIIDDVYFYNEEQETEGARLIDKTGTFDGSAPAAVLTKLVLNGQAISKITCGDKTLDSSTDYSWNGSQVTLNTPFTQTLENGKYEIVYHFSDGTADTFILTVINSSVTDDITVDNVTNFTSTNATDSSLTLAWDKNNKADGYTVEIYKGGKWNEIYSGADASCTAKDLRASSTYTFRIRAYKASGGTTYYSDYVRLAAKTAESSSVSNVTSFRKISATSSELIIGWAKNNSAEGYIVEQYKGGKWTEVLRTCTNSTVGFIAGDLKAGTTYTFRIRAYKTSGDTVIYSNYTRLAAVTNAN